RRGPRGRGGRPPRASPPTPARRRCRATRPRRASPRRTGPRARSAPPPIPRSPAPRGRTPPSCHSKPRSSLPCPVHTVCRPDPHAAGFSRRSCVRIGKDAKPMEHFDLSSVSTQKPSTWQKVKDGASDAYHQLAFKVTGNHDHLKALSRNKEAGLNLPQTNMFQENAARGGELADIALAAQPTTGDKVKNAVVPRFVSAAQENAQLGTFKAERTAAGELPAGSEERAVVNHIKGTTK